MNAIEQLLTDKANGIRELWFDVDGVMTPQGVVTIYDVRSPAALTGFERKDGITSVRLVPCDEHGNPVENVVEYIAGYTGEPVMEGYRFDPRDGKVVEYLVQHGFSVYFISGRDSACVRKRAIALGAVPLLGVKDKLSLMQKTVKCSLEQVLFVGDGIQDCEALRAVGVSIAPGDASPDAKLASMCTTTARGGEGVLDEILRIFFRVRGIELT